MTITMRTFLNSIASATIAAISVIIGMFLFSDCDLYLKFCQFDKKKGFKDKVVWIVGASSGIGSELTMNMVKSGATVVISARRADLLHDVASKASKYGIKPIVIPCDMLDLESQKKAYVSVKQLCHEIDIIILAGIILMQLFSLHNEALLT